VWAPLDGDFESHIIAWGTKCCRSKNGYV
jgi:hypothetical protein